MKRVTKPQTKLNGIIDSLHIEETFFSGYLFVILESFNECTERHSESAALPMYQGLCISSTPKPIVLEGDGHSAKLHTITAVLSLTHTTFRS